MTLSSSTSSSKAILRTLATFGLFCALTEAFIQLTLHPADLADIRQAQATTRFSQSCLVLGDSVANQLAPPIDGSPIRRFAVRLGKASRLKDERGSAGPELDARCAFLTTTAGATRIGDLLLLERAFDAGSAPTEIHLVLSAGGWSLGRDGNWNFDDGFAQRFSSPGQIAEIYSIEHDLGLLGRQIALGWLPSLRARGPYGQRLLSSLVPRPAPPPLGLENPNWSLSAWNRDALARILRVTEAHHAKLYVHFAPYARGNAPTDVGSRWKHAMTEFPAATVGSSPEAWDPELFRDGIHLQPQHEPLIATWFLKELDATSPQTKRP
ncbi:MAG: hypothetical protein AB7K71_34310 [Polyangiaceae bacterium]